MTHKKRYVVKYSDDLWEVWQPDWDSPTFVSVLQGRLAQDEAESVCEALNDAYETGLQDQTTLNVLNDTPPTSIDWYLVVIDEGESGIFSYAVQATSADEAESKALEDSKDDDDGYGHDIVSCWNCGKNAPKLA